MTEKTIDYEAGDQDMVDSMRDADIQEQFYPEKADPTLDAWGNVAYDENGNPLSGAYINPLMHVWETFN
jgi:hypothetical protein